MIGSVILIERWSILSCQDWERGRRGVNWVLDTTNQPTSGGQRAIMLKSTQNPDITGNYVRHIPAILPRLRVTATNVSVIDVYRNLYIFVTNDINVSL